MEYLPTDNAGFLMSAPKDTTDLLAGIKDFPIHLRSK